MDIRKQTRSARTTIRERKGWQKKVEPVYVQMLEYYKRVCELSRSSSEADRQEAERLKRNPPEDLKEKVRRLGEERRKSGVAIIPVATTILGSSDPDVALHDVRYMQHWLAWNKYGKTLEQLVEEDRAAIAKSSSQLLSVQRDFQDWRYGKLRPEELKTKFDREHWTLIAMGLNFGIDKLSQEDLADFADEMCGCGNKTHSPENLRKLRYRILEALQRRPS